MVNSNEYGLIYAITWKSCCILSLIKENPGKPPKKKSVQLESRPQRESDSLCVQSLWNEYPTRST